MSLLSGQKEKAELDADTASLVADQDHHPLFNPQERLMIERVLNLNQRSVSSIMTSRHDIERINLSAPEEERSAAWWRKISIPAWWSPAGRDNEDLLGVVHVIDLLSSPLSGAAGSAGAGASAAGLPGGLPLSLGARAVPQSPHPLLPLWSMSLAVHRGDCDPQRRDGDHSRKSAQ